MSSPSLPLRPWLGTLALIAIVACLQSLLFPRWPQADPLNHSALTKGLTAAGFKPKQRPSLPATRTYDRASSPVLVWNLAGGQELRMVRASSRERMQFQLAFLARAVPDLSIKNRVVLNQPIPTAIGLSQGRLTRLTCLLPSRDGSPSFGVSYHQLETIQSKQVLPRSVRLGQVLGLTPATGNTCVLVSLRAKPGQQLPSAQLWDQVLRAVSPVVLHGASSKTTP